MTSERWVVSDVDDYDQNTAGRPLPSLVSLHFVRSALRRRWWVCVLFAVLGLLMAIAFLLTSSTSHVAKAALVLAHDPQVDSSRAMSTDVSLLTTRTVANETIASLRLDMTPDEFRQSVTAEPVSSELLSLTLTAPSDAEAVRRLEALTSIYLNFRAEQLSAQSNTLLDGMRQRIQQLQVEMAQRSKEIDRLANARSAGGTKLSDTIAERAYIQQQIETLQQSIQDTTLRSASVVSSSRVVDPAAVDTAGVKRRAALTLASGLIGGAALGCGIVLFFAITSDRLRRRSDVSAALEAPLVSVGRIAPVSKRWVWLPHLRKLDSHRTDERQRLARAIEMELSTPRRAGRLAVACIDNADEVRFAVATAAADLVASGCTVALIDLSERGSLVEVAPSVADPAGSLTVLRPRGLPALAAGPDDLSAVGHKDGSSPSLELNDVTLVFSDLDPSVGADHLATWTKRVIVAVTAGCSSAEKVRTMAELVRTAGLDFRLAALLHTESTDNSSAAIFDRRPPMHFDIDQGQPLLASEERPDDVQAVAAATASAVAPATTEEQETAVELTLAREQVAAEEQVVITEEQAAADEQPAEQEVVTANEPAKVAAGQPEGPAAPADEEPAADDERAADQQMAKEEAALEKQVVTEEDEAAKGEPAAKERAATTDNEVVGSDKLPAPDQPAAAHEQAALRFEEEARLDARLAAADEQAIAEEEPAPEKEAVDEQQPTEEPVADREQPAEEQLATEELLAVAEQTSAEDWPNAADELSPLDQPAADAVEEEAALEDEVATEEQEAANGEPVAEEHASADERRPPADDLAALDEEAAPDEKLSAADEQAVAEEEQPATTDDVVAITEQALEEERVTADEEQPTHGQPAAREPAALVEKAGLAKQTATADEQGTENKEQGPKEQTVAEEEVASTDEENLAQEKPADEEPAAEQHMAAEEHTAAADQQAIDEDQTAEPDHVPDPLEEGAVDGWDLYIMRYPPPDRAPARESEDGESDWSWDWDDLGDIGSRRVPAVVRANYDAAVSNSENGSVPRANAEGDGRVGGVEHSAGNAKKPGIVARTRTRTRTKSRSRRRSGHK